MSKHTPGPWMKAETRTEGFVITSLLELIVHSVDEYGHYGPIKSSDNASLIAAAPDLLEALEKLLIVFTQTDAPDGLPEELSAHAAIAKAKGLTP